MLQDHTVLPTLTLNDIPKQLVFTDSDVKMIISVVSLVQSSKRME